jgi:hypothetical protein
MRPEQLRIHALDVAVRLNPSPTNLEELFSTAELIAKYISPPPAVKKTKHQYTSAEIHDLIDCSKSVSVFAQHCKVQHPVRGLIPLQPYAFQDVALHHFQNHKCSIMLKGRQMGLSTCEAVYALWKAMFTPNATIVIGGSSFSLARDMLDRVRAMIEGLPDFLKPELVTNNKGHIAFDNGSQIFARSIADGMVRGMSVSLLILDELAYVGDSRANDMWASCQPTLGRTQVLIASSAGRDTGTFYLIWRGANDQINASGVGANGFAPLELPWWRHPERDQAWAEQEFGCQFRAA